MKNLVYILCFGLAFSFINTAKAQIVWEQVGDTIDAEADDDRCGWSVALSEDGSIIAVGSPYHSETKKNKENGAVRVFEVDGSDWTQLGDPMYGADRMDNFGHSVSLSADGTIVAIGAPFNKGSKPRTGHVQVLEFDGSDWNQLGSSIEGDDANNQFGYTLSLSADGEVLAIGGRNHTEAYVRLFEFDGSDWEQVGDDIEGWSVALSADGTVLAVGSGYQSEDSTANDLVTIYGFDGTDWEQLGDEIEGEIENDLSGHSISLNGNGTVVAIGAHWNNGTDDKSGSVRVYGIDDTEWMQLGNDIDGETGKDRSGYSVSLSDNGLVLAVGAPWNAGNGRRTGQVRVYGFDGSDWIQVGDDIDGEELDEELGYDVAISGDGITVAGGAPFNDENGRKRGQVRIFEPAVSIDPIGTDDGNTGTDDGNTGTDDGNTGGDNTGGGGIVILICPDVIMRFVRSVITSTRERFLI